MAQNAGQAAATAAIMSSMGLPTFAAGGAMTAGSAGPSSANNDGIMSITPAFDSSNWTVATGSSKATASNTSASGQPGLTSGLGGAASQLGGAVSQLAANPAMLIAAIVVGIVLWKRL